MLPRLHRLDPQVSKSECLHNDCHYWEGFPQSFCSRNWIDNEEYTAYWKSQCHRRCDPLPRKTVCEPFLCTFCLSDVDTHKYKSAHNKISSPLIPVLVTWALGYIVAKLFFAVVEMSIDTIILSFCQDAEEHQGNAHYAPPLLMETLDEQSDLQRLTLDQGP